jgi:nitroimidazol reductase NimA-like FMN-containing flavoprotein (pyridoxamine 5'-phosphate oxidase superfamily)
LRRKDKEITDRETIDRIIAECDVLRLALAKDNLPYLVPVSFGYDGSAFYFHSARQGRKLDFFQANAQVCFELEHGVALKPHPTDPCEWTFAYRCIVGYGTVRELTGFEEKHEGLVRIMRQYAPGEYLFGAPALANLGVWRLQVDSISGKQSGYPGT